MIYYKVTTKDNESISRTLLGSNEIVKYKINEWVFSPVPGKFLFVFNNLNDAKDFAIIPDCKIYECEVNGFNIGPQQKLDFYLQPPNGTVQVYGVKLIKEIENEKNIIIENGQYIVCESSSHSFVYAKYNDKFIYIDRTRLELGYEPSLHWKTLGDVKKSYPHYNIKIVDELTFKWE